MVLATVLTKIIGFWRNVGNKFGYQMEITLTDHNINIKMSKFNKQKKAYDETQYTRGNIFIKDYGNPIKPQVTQKDNTENSNNKKPKIKNTKLIPSFKYKEYMNQHLIKELKEKPEDNKKLLYGIILIMFLNLGSIALLLSQIMG